MIQNQNACRGVIETGSDHPKNNFDLILSSHLDTLIVKEDTLIEQLYATPERADLYRELAWLRSERSSLEGLVFGGQR